MKVKVCGVTSEDSAREISRHPVDYLGIIFVPSSPRFVSIERAEQVVKSAPNVSWVGVFVNALPRVVEEAVQVLSLSVVQLHGDEDCGYVESLREKLREETKIWKVKGVHGVGDVEYISEWNDWNIDAVLLDTKREKGSCRTRGGTGEKFDWSLLKEIHTTHKIVLSGGIGPEDADLVRDIVREVPSISAIDINSRFETSPGEKDTKAIARFLEELKQP